MPRYNRDMAEVQLTFDVTREEDGYCAVCSFPGHGLFTQGDSLEELHRNIDEVVQLHLESLADEFGNDAPDQAIVSAVVNHQGMTIEELSTTIGING